ncbi:MAG: CocE/NonD family hydrolase [Solirubrobacteraceae bacterium]
MRASLTALVALLAIVALAPAAAQAAPWYEEAGATHSEAFITEPDGTTLHADVLRPKGLPATARTPVILSIGPYFNHSGQTGPAGPAEGTSYDPIGSDGPIASDRFADFVKGAHLMARGYTYVMVDLRGFGGSSGCLDWAGPGEQADVKSAVQWAASQPWSTGHVGMYGKSYDAVTGLIGEAQQPTGLSAIVSQEPVYDLYRYLYTNGVRYVNSLATPALYDGIAATPGPATDSPQYNADAIDDSARPGCPAANYLDQASNSDHASPYWRARDPIAATRGHAIPLFLTQGFLENNTKPDGTADFFNGFAGPRHGWFGMWDHIRGNETAEGLNDAQQPWFDEVMRFYDHYVAGVSLTDAPTDRDPVASVQTSDGSWRAEQGWPADDSTGYATPLRPGAYTDTANNSGSAEGQGPTDTVGKGVWTISPKLGHDAWFSGVPSVKVDVSSAAPNANLSVDVYDIDAKNWALLLSRTAQLLPAGDGTFTPQMYDDDWRIPAGHRLGVLVTTANDEWWSPTPNGSQVTLKGGSVTLPFLKYTRTATIPGKDPARRAAWLKAAPFTIDQATIDASTSPGFALPPALTARPAAATAARHAGARGSRLKVRTAWHGSRRLVVFGNAPKGWRIRTTVRRGRSTRAVRRSKANRYGFFRLGAGVRRRAGYRVTVTAAKGRQRVTRTVRVARR